MSTNSKRRRDKKKKNEQKIRKVYSGKGYEIKNHDAGFQTDANRFESNQRVPTTTVIPEILYRYFKFDKYYSVEKLLENKNIYFRKPDFNDPFDCKIDIMLPKDILSKQRFSRRMAFENQRKLGKDFESEYNKFMREFDNPKWPGNIYESIMKCGFLCLSEERNNLLLWAHYAASHTGLCIGFDLPKTTPPVPLKVDYTNDFPIFKLSYDNFVKKVMLTKSKDWSYEKEWRLIYENSGYEVMHHMRIKELIFGCNILKENKEKILQLLKNHEFSHVRLYQAKVSKSKFELDFEQLEF